MSNLENVILKTIERFMAGRKSKRYGLVTSWDATNHRAKVTFMPEGNESGWLPVQAMASGNGWGMVCGLTAGDGKTTGDLVEIHYQEGDYENGQIAGRVHNDVDKPPPVQSGEMLIQHQSGASIKFDKNGVLTIKGSGGSSTVHAADGSVTHTDGGGGVLKQSGGGFTHNGHHIDASHTHTGVQTGSGTSGIPT